MPTIKLNSSGLIITKGGLPSCTCCGVCSPNITTVYAEMDITSESGLSYETLTGSLNSGEFVGERLILSYSGESWFVQAQEIGTFSPIPVLTRCDPFGEYFNATGLDTVIISATPF